MATARVLAGALLLAGCTGAPKELPPRSPPPRSAPSISLPQAPIPEGHGRVVLDTTDGPMKVVARGDHAFVPPGHQVRPTRTGMLCVTPCVVDLPRGHYELFLTSADGSYERGDKDQLVVGPGTQYHVRAPGRYEPATWLHVGPSLLIAAATIMTVTGAVFLGGTGDADGDGKLDEPSEGSRNAGLVLLGGGVALGIGGGIWLYDESRGATQRGATTRWNEP